ncbi:MAG: ATP-dependent DNA helicase RecG, partial [Saprospiraceae bacterium]|nr:ATP-dependent DNA helicase RecG [Saprospiraceae bacterium]
MFKSLLDQEITYVKGVGPTKAMLLRNELGIESIHDLLTDYPIRYEDRTRFQNISEITSEGDVVQLRGTLTSLSIIGGGRKKRLVGRFEDSTGYVELVWFRSIKWLKDNLLAGQQYILYGRVNKFRGKVSMAHPEIELASKAMTAKTTTFVPVYRSTEKLGASGLDSRGRRKVVSNLFDMLHQAELPEHLPQYILGKLHLPSLYDSLRHIHFPSNNEGLRRAEKRLKFDEFFVLQLGILKHYKNRQEHIKGYVFPKIGKYFNNFYADQLTFTLTQAQKRVLKEIRKDLKTGIQMNRLLQGDVGSGKTIVALMTMLIALDNGFQAALMAPTEILAQQHNSSIKSLIGDLGLRVGLLTGSIKGNARKELLRLTQLGEIHILIGTHALIEDKVVFHNLGLAIIDEQHRFGVAQRARLWKKSKDLPPHILVMTATPIPRTLHMTVYGDLDVSIIDELPPGRKPVKTEHKTEYHRPEIIKFIKVQIKEGRQVYIVYPLIEESEKLDLEDLNNGYERLLTDFPAQQYQISVVHGRLKQEDKDFEMRRFVEGITQIMVATTVIEVGVDIPNASVMIIENSERFGLSQLHQLRGRVGRGANQSFCILMSSYRLTEDAKERLQTMVRTHDGFEIAEVDLRLRGPGTVRGT